VLTVVKVGGALARDAVALRAWCAQLAACGARHPLLVVPGGGSFADAVREHDHRFGLGAETAHWMAILAMDQLGWALSELIPGAVRRSDLEPVHAGAVSVLLPFALLRERDPLPASWAVTADSIAAWVAGAARAERVVLVKAVAGLARAQLTVDELEALGPEGVDGYLPTALRSARVETWVIGGEPARLAELLDTGSTAGTRITRPA
jgi:5-(aminomethyl)-3-furanmethanol phosphate kinase